MKRGTIWRYLSLAKYIDLLRTQCLFFAKASNFVDTAEGKWVQHVLLRERSQQDKRLQEHVQQLKDLMARAGNNPTALSHEANIFLQSRRDDKLGVLGDVLSQAQLVYPHKRREYLENHLISWQQILANHIVERNIWIYDAEIYRQSTYVSCWNRLDSTSLAMWELYGKGQEGVAICSTESKLQAVINHNSAYLEKQGHVGEIVAVRYLDELKNPNEDTQNKVKDILTNASDTSIALFSIKPNMFAFEHEVRAIIFPKRDPFKSPTDPEPERLGFELSVGKLNAESKPSLSKFIDAVHIYPTLGRDSMMFQVVTEINRRFEATELEIVADRLTPFED